MKTIYKSILIFSAGLISLNTFAQKADTVLTRQVYLEREYNPTLNEATKINTAPNIFTPKVQSLSSARFLDQAPQLSLQSNKLGKVASGDIRTDIPFSKQRFYLKAGGGTHGMIDGLLGVRAIDTQNDKLDLAASYSGMSGNVDYEHPTDLIKKAKAKYNDLKIGLNYEHHFQPSIFSFGGSFQSMGFNYYGTPFSSEAILDNLDMDSKQKVDIISFKAGLRSSDQNQGLLKYKGNIAYTSFKSKYGYLPSIDKGPRGGILEADVDFYTSLGSGDIGFAASVLNQSFTSKTDYDSPDANNFTGMTNVTLSPYYKIGDTNWDVNLGANLSYVDDRSGKFIVTPNVKAQVHINEVNTIYAGITGGVNNNTLLDVLNENRYVNPIRKVEYSKTLYDINLGFKSGVIPNLEFEVFGGYKHTKNDHLYVAHSTFYNIDGVDLVTWGNLGTPIYDQISTGHFGGEVKTKLIPATTLKGRLTGYFYNVKENDKAWGRPTFTADITADIKPFDKLTISLQYLLMGGRKGLSSYTHVEADAVGNIIELTENSLPTLEAEVRTMSMKAINEFNVHVEYELLKYLSIYGRVNNVLNQKYEQHLGYTMQGFNALGGVSLKF